MRIYKHEIKLKEKILASANIKFPIEAKIISNGDKEKIQTILSSRVKNTSETVIAGMNGPHPYLLYASAILCSTCTNLNDDTFIPSETWKARATIMDMPFNDEHDNKKIIGHVVGKRCVKADGSIVEDDCMEPPDYFDVETDLVMYGEVYPELANKIMKDGPDSKLGVSMECDIYDFCYGIYNNNVLSVVDRTEENSYLSQYLRAYGGAGEYQGKKLVRVLKDIVFKGIANTANPANPASMYTKLNGIQIVKADFDCIKDIEKLAANKKEGKSSMFKTIEEAINHIASQDSRIKLANDEIAKLTAQIGEFTKAGDKKALEDAQKALVVAQEQIKVLESNIKKFTDDVSAKVSEIDSVKKELAEAVAKRDEYKSIIDKANATKIGAERVEKLEKLGNTFEKRDEAIAKYAKFDEDSFGEILATAEKFHKKLDTSKATQSALDEAGKNITDVSASVNSGNSDKSLADIMKEELRTVNKKKQNPK